MVDASPQLPVARRRRNILLAMLAVVAAVVVLVLWDGQREAQARLDQLARRHHLVAFGLALDFAERFKAINERAYPDPHDKVIARERLLERALDDAARLERAGNLIVLVHLPDRGGFRRTSGAILNSPKLDAALERGDESLTLGETDATTLGLERNYAVVGLAQVEDRSGLPPVRLVVASSARGEGVRVTHDFWRAIISIAGVTAIVLAFGGLVLREQRRELDLAASLQREHVERERDEQLARAQRLATLAALSTGIAHELATPLGVIAGRAEQLGRAGGHDPSSARALRAIDEQIERMRAVMEGFLALARGQNPTLQSIAAADVAREAATLVASRFEKSNIALEVPSPSKSRVKCDPRLFVQVLVNLLVNACQASASGARVILRVRDEGARVAFRITDEGEGIAPEVLARVTEPFFTTRTKSGGSGLGLAIAKELTEQHGGTLQVGPRPEGRGTVATVDLPRAEET
jgi:signal transduction histidine kinase